MEHAVVLGGGIAGLLAARVLADHARQVTIVERDGAQPPAASAAGPRKGVPQGRHAHALLVRGLGAIEGLLPGFTAEAVRKGAIPANAARDASWGLAGQRLAPADDDLPVIAATRPFIEAEIRARVTALANVHFIEGAELDDLILDGSRVAGVAISSHGSSTAATLAADLVIDARGRASSLPAWLRAHGYPAPQEDEVEIGVGYTTIQFRDADEAIRRAGLGDRVAIIVGATPDHPFGGVLHRVEGNRIEVSLAGYAGHHPPDDLEGFVAFAARLALPDLHRAVAGASPCSKPAVFRVPRSVRRHYEKLKRFPAGILPLGDAICAFNPIFAQGMSVAAMQAVALGRALAESSAPKAAGLPPLAARFLTDAARIIDPAWAMAKSNDLLAPHLRAHQTFGGRLLATWIARVIRAGATDAEIARRFIRVASLVDPPQTLLSPGVIRRVLFPRPAAASQREVEPLASPLPPS
jgi:2-polyprenyl-6-methoxyphenol hydroxylase-like FAD-dependent oxidoreductase